VACQLESHFKRAVKKRLDAIDDLYYFVKEAASIRGLPDIVGCYRGVFFAWELKKDLSEASKRTGRIVLQRHILSLIRRCGGIGEVVYPENFEECLKNLLESCPKQ
jgi:hypothetical protein